jgi:hypothetical protein
VLLENWIVEVAREPYFKRTLEPLIDYVSSFVVEQVNLVVFRQYDEVAKGNTSLASEDCLQLGSELTIARVFCS